ncbi:GTP-binding protein [Streptomyces sp. DK15]|uniref:GTP-binding protein n=1 Tax=Streptomyces sp. DK15 TaxID=2957499 RepID=UPI0029B0A233|nr:GTP-binding protein [Streptomyces sp. DK15]MDX2393593.1 GTP-binding protein [Streptomyces sp. DK15]
MVTEQVQRRPFVNIGTLGHEDHGKTTLAAALIGHYGDGSATYAKIDKALEGRHEGWFSISSSHIEYATAVRDYGHVDHPTHADHCKAMISGGAPWDCAILVVSAFEGAMPQTREHVRLARLVGIPHMVVFLNKSDMADEETLDLVEEEVREVLTRFGYPGDTVPVVRGSALLAMDGDERGVEQLGELVKHLDTYVPHIVRGEKPDTRAPQARFEAQLYLYAPNENGRTAPLPMPSRTSFAFTVTTTAGTFDDVAVGSLGGPGGASGIGPGEYTSVKVTLEDTIPMKVGSTFAVTEGSKTFGRGIVSKILG